MDSQQPEAVVTLSNGEDTLEIQSLAAPTELRCCLPAQELYQALEQEALVRVILPELSLTNPRGRKEEVEEAELSASHDEFSDTQSELIDLELSLAFLREARLDFEDTRWVGATVFGRTSLLLEV